MRVPSELPQTSGRRGEITVSREELDRSRGGIKAVARMLILAAVFFLASPFALSIRGERITLEVLIPIFVGTVICLAGTLKLSRVSANLSVGQR